jgi:hypothetical protein
MLEPLKEEIKRSNCSRVLKNAEDPAFGIVALGKGNPDIEPGKIQPNSLTVMGIPTLIEQLGLKAFRFPDRRT